MFLIDETVGLQLALIISTLREIFLSRSRSYAPMINLLHLKVKQFKVMEDDKKHTENRKVLGSVLYNME